MLNNVTDEQLIHSYQKGENEAFETLYRRYKKAIYHYFFRQVHSISIADELHQDVWLNIIKSSSAFKQESSSAFKQESSFKTWLYTVAHNRLIDHYRQNTRQALSLVQTFNQPDDSSEESSQAIEAVNNHADAPEETLQEQQIRHALIQRVKTLPEEQKEVFLLHENSGLTLQEIALVTNSSFESTKSRLRYAVKKLRLHMAQYLSASE